MSALPDVILFQPIYQTRVWGGRRLAERLGRTLPDDQPYGEAWEIVDRPEAQSRIANGAVAGLTLRALIEREAEALLGVGYPPERPFPILVKWLDCRERLSLQVHPPADIAPELHGEPKTENWYIAECEERAALLAGLRSGVTLERFENALERGELEPLVHRIEVQVGDSLFVPSGRIHAIDAGNLILEVQQNSDTTYRVYDWGRVGLDGQPRQLHIQESLRSIDFDDFEPEVLRPGPEALLVDSPIFRLLKHTLAVGMPVPFSNHGTPALVHVVEGRLESPEGPLERGTNCLVPACASPEIVAAADGATVLVTDRFV